MESGKEKMEEGVQTCLQWKEKRGGNKNRVREGREFKTLGFRDWERERESLGFVGEKHRKLERENGRE